MDDTLDVPSMDTLSQSPDLSPLSVIKRRRQDSIHMNPSSTHSVLLANKKRVIISFYFDPTHFSLDPMKDIVNLEDLCFVFEPIGDENGRTTLFSFCSDHFNGKMVERSVNGARLRVGGMIGVAVREKRIMSQTRGRTIHHEFIQESIIFTMNITVHKMESEKFQSRFFYSPNHQFLLTCGRRRFEMNGVIGGKAATFALLPSPEIISLNSTSCLHLLYRNSIIPKEDPILLPDINPFLLQFSLSLVAFGKKHRLAAPNCEYSMALIRFLDRFAFMDASYRLKMSVVNRIINHDVEVKEDSFPLMDYMGDEEIRKKFFNRFTSIECLNGIGAKFTGTLSMSNLIQMHKHRVNLYAAIPLRPKIRFIFSEGEIVCSLFHDFHPTAISVLLSIIRCRSYHRIRLSTLWTRSGSLSLIDLPSPSLIPSVNRVSSLSSSFWLSYNTHGLMKRLFIYHGKPEKGLVLGTVVSGIQILSAVTQLESVAII